MNATRKSPLARAMDAKRRRWEAEHELDGMGWGRLPEWQTPEFLDWSEIYERAKAEHRKHITTAWLYRLADRVRAA